LAVECEVSEAKESLRLSREVEALARAQRDEERRRRALLELAAMVKAEDAARVARDNQAQAEAREALAAAAQRRSDALAEWCAGARECFMGERPTTHR